MDLAETLESNGWGQGSMFPAHGMKIPYLRRDATKISLAGPVSWDQHLLDTNPEDMLVVASHPCDLIRSLDREPLVELLRASWTTDRRTIVEASKNSPRRFLMQRRMGQDGEEGLVVAATPRCQIDKEALLSLEPTPGFAVGDLDTPRIFARWLGDRFARQMLPPDIETAVSIPLANAIGKLAKSSPHQATLDSIREIRYLVDQGTAPFEVTVWLMSYADSNPPIEPDKAEAAALIDWMDQKLTASGLAQVVGWEILDTTSVSFRDYIESYGLNLSPYSLSSIEPPI